MKPTVRPLLVHIFPTFDMGGAQKRFAALAGHFGTQFRHTVIAMDGRYGAMAGLNASLDVAIFSIKATKGGPLGNLTKIRKALVALKPDILITHNWGSIEWAVGKVGLPLRHIHIEDGFGPDEAAGQKRRRIWARRAVLRKSAVVVPSQTLARIACHDWRVPPARLHFISNGIDCTRFARPENSIAANTPVIGTVAALREEKNLHRLIQAFALARRTNVCQLTIVGDGAERASLEALAKILGVAEYVTFMGHIDDPSPLYAGFDIFALTSDTEQMPYTILEAMAAGCPIVATDVGDIRAMVADSNKHFIVARDEQAIAGALRTLLEDKVLRLSLGKANSAVADSTYDQREMFEKFAQIFNAALYRDADADA